METNISQLQNLRIGVIYRQQNVAVVILSTTGSVGLFNTCSKPVFELIENV
jgi:hypothetical protein